MNHACLLYLTGTFLFCIRGTFRYVGRGAAHAVCAPARHSQATTKDKAFDHAKKSPRGASTLRPCPNVLMTAQISCARLQRLNFGDRCWSILREWRIGMDISLALLSNAVGPDEV